MFLPCRDSAALQEHWTHVFFSNVGAPKAHSHCIIHFLVEHGTEMIKEFPLNPLLIPGNYQQPPSGYLDSDVISETETTIWATVVVMYHDESCINYTGWWVQPS